MAKIFEHFYARRLLSYLNQTKLRNAFLNKPSINNESFNFYSSGSNSIKVTVLGAGGNLGKSVSLMLKQSPFIDELCLYDNKSLAGFVTDLNYLDTRCTVTTFCGSKDIKQALSRSSVVLILAAAPHSTTLNAVALFERNAAIVKDLAADVAKVACRSMIAISTDPINSIVPMFSEIMKKNGHYNPNAIFGITTVDVVRANKFVAEVMGIDPECVVVPVIGGHTEKTIVPVLSQAKPCNNFTNDELEDITISIRAADENLLRVRASEGAYLSKAFAISRFVISLVKALRGQNEIVECAFVKSTAHPQLKYMATPVLLGPGGIAKNLGIPDLSDYEYCLLENAIPLLIDDIKKGEYVGGRAMDCVKGKLQDRPVCDPCDPKVAKCPPDHCEMKSLVEKCN